MVFTVRVRRADQRLSRRGLLAAAVGGMTALGLGACDLGSTTTVLWHPAPDALLPFLASTVALADIYDAAIRTLPSLAGLLTPLRDAHRQHIVALQRELGLVGTTPTPAAPTTPAAPATPTSATPPTQAAPPSASYSPSADPSSSSSPSSFTGGSASVPPSQAPTPASSATPGASAPAGTLPSPVLPSDRAALITVLRAAEQKGQADATAACLAAPTYRAALLGSIAACRSTHLVVLA